VGGEPHVRQMILPVCHYHKGRLGFWYVKWGSLKMPRVLHHSNVLQPM